MFNVIFYFAHLSNTYGVLYFAEQCLKNIKNGVFNIFNISIVSIQPWPFWYAKIITRDDLQPGFTTLKI